MWASKDEHVGDDIEGLLVLSAFSGRRYSYLTQLSVPDQLEHYFQLWQLEEVMGYYMHSATGFVGVYLNICWSSDLPISIQHHIIQVYT